METKYVLVNGVKRRAAIDKGGVLRFRQNRIIRDLLDAASESRRMDMNDIASRVGKGYYTRKERKELYRLIGYSISGYQDIFEEETVDQAEFDEELERIHHSKDHK